MVVKPPSMLPASRLKSERSESLVVVDNASVTVKGTR